MKLKKFKEKDNKRIGIIVFTLVCVLLVSGVILYRTFAIFEVKTNQNVIKGNVQDPGNLYFVFYQKNEESGEYEIQKEMPNLKDEYVLDEVQSYCGVNGERDENIEVYLSEDGYIKVKGMTASRTKCNLYFAKGVFIKEKGIPVVTSGDGLYKVEHPTSETEGMEEGWRTKEYRFAGKNPNNYVWFNEELWRIIGFVNVKVANEDGNEGIEQRLKIIRNEKLSESMPWNNASSINDWTNASLMKELNEGNYYQNNLKNQAKEMIDTHIIWNIGGYDSNVVMTKEIYKYERGTTGGYLVPKVIEWKNGQVGLMYPSDYGYAVGGDSRTCIDSNNLREYNLCSHNNWLSAGYDEWTLCPLVDSFRAFHIFLGSLAFRFSDNLLDVRPVLYLESDVHIISGTGTIDDVFEIAQVLK